MNDFGQAIAFDQDNKKIFVNGAVTDDEIEVSIIKKNNKFTLAKIEEIINPSNFRQAAPCRYFDDCGGCNLQHLENQFYLDFKLNNVKEALKKQGIIHPQINFIKIGENSRRRLNLQIDHNNKLGFFKENSHDLVNISDCLMAEKEIAELITKLQNLLHKLGKNLFKSINICQFDNVVEIILNFKKKQATFEENQILTDFARNNKNINLSTKIKNSTTPIYQSSKAYLELGSLKIYPPSNIFLQATKKGQKAIISEIENFILENNSQNIIDLYCGIGTYSFSIINKINRSICFEGNEEMAQSININAGKNNLSHKINAKSRNLTSNPAQDKELNNIDLAIIIHLEAEQNLKSINWQNRK